MISAEDGPARELAPRTALKRVAGRASSQGLLFLAQREPQRAAPAARSRGPPRRTMAQSTRWGGTGNRHTYATRVAVQGPDPNGHRRSRAGPRGEAETDRQAHGERDRTTWGTATAGKKRQRRSRLVGGPPGNTYRSLEGPASPSGEGAGRASRNGPWRHGESVTPPVGGPGYHAAAPLSKRNPAAPCRRGRPRGVGGRLAHHVPQRSGRCIGRGRRRPSDATRESGGGIT